MRRLREQGVQVAIFHTGEGGKEVGRRPVWGVRNERDERDHTIHPIQIVIGRKKPLPFTGSFHHPGPAVYRCEKLCDSEPDLIHEKVDPSATAQKLVNLLEGPGQVEPSVEPQELAREGSELFL